MIIEFSVKNYKSIENLTFNLSASNKIKDYPENISTIYNVNLLNSCIIYGRNASGKSNILQAINELFFFVLSSDENKHSEKILSYFPFYFDKKVNNQPIEFDITFLTKEKFKFRYNIRFNSQKILYETLYYYANSKPSKLFMREDGKSISYGEHYRGIKKILENNLLENQLFLSKSASNNIDYLKQAYLYFENYINFYVSHEDSRDKALLNYISSELYNNQNKSFKHNLMVLLKASDTNIDDFEIYINEVDKAYRINTKHKLFDGSKLVGDMDLYLIGESLGTQKLFMIGGLIIKALSNGGVIVIDELDKSLHPLLTRMLIKLFHNKKTNPKNAQLIFASHDSSLLDNELFRRDQIYFVEKDYHGKSSLYRLSDFKGVRNNTPYDKWYLSGRFSAIPVLDESLEFKFD